MAAVFAFDEGRAPAAGVVARALAFHLDHVGAEIGQYLPRPGACENAGQFKHTNASQGSRHCTNLQMARHRAAQERGVFCGPHPPFCLYPDQ